MPAVMGGERMSEARSSTLLEASGRTIDARVDGSCLNNGDADAVAGYGCVVQLDSCIEECREDPAEAVRPPVRPRVPRAGVGPVAIGSASLAIDDGCRRGVAGVKYGCSTSMTRRRPVGRATRSTHPTTYGDRLSIVRLNDGYSRGRRP